VKVTYKKAHTDSLNKGYCTVTTRTMMRARNSLAFTPAPVEPQEKFSVAYASMTLGNSLTMRFAFPADAAADWNGCYAEIVKIGPEGQRKVQTVTSSDWMTANINGTAHLAVAFDGIAAKEMADRVEVTLYNGQGQAVSETWTDSVRDYVLRSLENGSFDDETKVMAVDMLNYGAAAQEYFGYGADDLANSGLSEEHRALASQDAPISDSRVKGTNYLATQLMLENNIRMRMAFKNVDESMTAKVSYTDHYGKEVTHEVPVTVENGMGVVTIDTLVVADSRCPVTVKIYDGEKLVAEATDSVESYVARMEGKDGLFRQLMRFSDSAYACFH
jgi:hypothetical protein